MSFNAMGFKEYVSFLMEEFRALWIQAVNGYQPSIHSESDQKRPSHFVFAPQYSFCRISRK